MNGRRFSVGPNRSEIKLVLVVGIALCFLAAVQSFGNSVASVIVGLLWTLFLTYGCISPHGCSFL